MKSHNYSAKITWTGNTGKGTSNYHAYERDYSILIEGKPVIKGSSDPAFLGDKSRYNPEELFLASISSCHMLWYLHLCAENGIIVIDYEDQATGKMIEETTGEGRFESVLLKPAATILDSEKEILARKLHRQANKKCFIANSCNFEISHEPVIVIEKQ